MVNLFSSGVTTANCCACLGWHGVAGPSTRQTPYHKATVTPTYISYHTGREIRLAIYRCLLYS